MTGRSQDDLLTWSFLAPGCPRPTGGDIARFEIVNALARAGHSVRVVHLPTSEMWIRELRDLPWFKFDPMVEHVFADDLDPESIPDSDVVVYSTKLLATALAPEVRAIGRHLVDALQSLGGHTWLPMLFLQGHGVFPPVVEELALSLPGPKVCVGSWLADLLRRRGVAPEDAVHIPNGIDPETFRIIRPIATRRPLVAMNFDPYPAKRGRVGIEALELLWRERGVPGALFGTIPLEREVEAGLSFLLSPSQATLAEAIYNEASTFLQPSKQEGFGLCAVEAMACGCALVTTSNGGSDDYAVDGETAIVCGGEVAEMTEAMGRLVADDSLRLRIATAGARSVEQFRWPTSASRIARLATERLAAAELGEPGRHVDIDPIISALGS